MKMPSYDELRHLLAGDTWSIHNEEKPSWSLVQQILDIRLRDKEPPPFFLDIGCQRGTYSQGLLESYANCRVKAFDLILYPEMKDLVNRYNNITFWQCALADGDVHQCMIHYPSQHRIEIATKPLDEFIHPDEIRDIEFIKVDVDGPHFEVLKGSSNILKQSSPLVMVEMHINIGYSDDPEGLRNEIMSLRSTNSDYNTLELMSGYGFNLVAVRNGMNAFFLKT